MTAQATIKVPAELFALAESSHFEGDLDLPLLSAGPDDYVFEGPLSWAVDVTNTGEALLVAGSVEAIATTGCARCLDPVSYDLAGDVEGYFIVEGQSDAPDGMDEDEYDVLPADHVIDLVPLIEAALLVEIPAVPLCADDCAGLCPTCGANLNEGPCGCEPDPDLLEFEAAANPFAALSGLVLGEEG